MKKNANVKREPLSVTVSYISVLSSFSTGAVPPLAVF